MPDARPARGKIARTVRAALTRHLHHPLGRLPADGCSLIPGQCEWHGSIEGGARGAGVSGARWCMVRAITPDTSCDLTRAVGVHCHGGLTGCHGRMRLRGPACPCKRLLAHHWAARRAARGAVRVVGGGAAGGCANIAALLNIWRARRSRGTPDGYNSGPWISSRRT